MKYFVQVWQVIAAGFFKHLQSQKMQMKKVFQKSRLKICLPKKPTDITS